MSRKWEDLTEEEQKAIIKEFKERREKEFQDWLDKGGKGKDEIS